MKVLIADATGSPLQGVAKSISGIALPDDTLQQIKAQFYQAMQDNGVYRGTKSLDGNGVICDNFEWTMCKDMLICTLSRQIELSIMFGDDLLVSREHEGQKTTQ